MQAGGFNGCRLRRADGHSSLDSRRGVQARAQLSTGLLGRSRRPGLCSTYIMARILVQTDELDKLCVGAETVVEGRRERHGIGLRIVDRFLELEIAVLYATVPLGDLPRRRERTATYV